MPFQHGGRLTRNAISLTSTTGDLSYVSRLADAETFGRLATGETHRRGVANREAALTRIARKRENCGGCWGPFRTGSAMRAMSLCGKKLSP